MQQCERFNMATDMPWLQFVLRNQRDLSWDQRLDQVLAPGVDITSMWFTNEVPTPARIEQVDSLLDMGYRRISVDLHWTGTLWALCTSVRTNLTQFNNVTNVTTWRLVNEWRCAPGLFERLLQRLSTWITNTASIWFQDVLNLAVRPRKFQNQTSVRVSGDETLLPLFSPKVSQLYTPGLQHQWNYNDSFWPSRKILVEREKRMFISVSNDELLLANSTQLYSVVFNSTAMTQVLSSHTSLDCSWRGPWLMKQIDPLMMLNETSPCHVVNEMVRCGYSPIVENEQHLLPAIIGTVWSWDFSQPANRSSASCAAMTPTGRWTEIECDKTRTVACKKQSEWSLGSVSSDYQGLSWSCPSEFSFSVPSSPVENTQLHSYYNQSGQNSLVMLDLSDRVVSGCWVRNGESCPYYDSRAAVLEIVRISAVGGVVILALFGIYMSFNWHKRQQTRQVERRKAESRSTLDSIDTASVPV